MRIAITADPFIPVPPLLYGGIERIIFMLVEQLQSRGHEIVLYAHKESEVSCELRAYPGESDTRYDNFKNFIAVSRIATGDFDVVHSFGRLAYLTALLPTSLPKLMSYQREPSIGPIKLAAKLAARNTLMFTGCSNYIANQISPHATAHAVFNGVDTDKFVFESEVLVDAPLVFLGRIEHIKGTHLAIEVAKAANRKLVIAGNVPDDEACEKYFREKVSPFIDGTQVIYMGPVDDVQKNKLLGRASALLMPILWNEPFGIVMAEALACGTPVIGFNRGSVPEIVKSGFNGFVCEQVEEMTEAVMNIGTLKRADCRASAIEKFSAHVIADEYERLYFHFADKHRITNSQS